MRAHSPNRDTTRLRSRTQLGRLLATALGTLAAVLATALPAAANSTQRTMLQDDTQMLSPDPAVRARALDETKGLGVEIVKVLVSWRDIAPEGATKPAGFVGQDPGAYPSESWALYDDLVGEARDRGLEVFMMIGGRAPDWASAKPGRCGGKPCPPGSTRPNPVEFGRFVTAVGKRYSGSYPNPGPSGGQLGRVGIWSVLNEPNLAKFLAPRNRRDRARTLVSPALYRGLYLAAHRALSATGHASDTILIGELLPFVRRSDAIAPLEFLREMACVDKNFRPFRGRAARLRGCKRRFRALPGTGVAYHPYTPAGGPRAKTLGKDDATIDTLGRLSYTLDQLSKRRRLAVRRMPIWITEFGFQTRPPDPFQAGIARVPGFMGEAEWLAFRNRRVASYSQYPLLDDATVGQGFGKFSGFQSGLRFSNGSVKPGVYDAFRLPFFVRLVSPSRVEVFGGVRAGRAGETVAVESGSGSNFTALRAGAATLGPAGYFRKVIRVRGAANKRFRFSYRSEKSRVARPVRRLDPRAQDRRDRKLLRKAEDDDSQQKRAKR